MFLYVHATSLFLLSAKKKFIDFVNKLIKIFKISILQNIFKNIHS
jgi:hypothetical protein